MTGPCCPLQSGNETATSSSRFPHLTIETSALPQFTGDRDHALIAVPHALPCLLPPDRPLVDVVVSLRSASPSLSLD